MAVATLPADCCDECPDGVTITAGGNTYTTGTCCDETPTLCGNVNIRIGVGTVVTVTV